MATISPGAFTYSEWALRHDSTGKVSTLINMMSQTNSILQDMLAVECQSGNAFEYTQVVKLPSPVRRVYNQGVPRSMSGVAKLVTTCSQYSDWSFFDKALAQLGGNVNELRAQEDALHMDGMGQSVAYDLFYANRATDPTAFTGLANIYNTVNTATSAIANNVIDCQGTQSDNTSMWLVYWDSNKIHTIFPKGIATGIQMQDYGDTVPGIDSNGNEYPAYRTYLSWSLGLAIHDWRYAVRACNIDVGDLAGGGAANLINILVRMANRTPTAPAGVAPVQKQDGSFNNPQGGRAAIYCNRTIAEYLQLQAMNKTNVLLQLQQWDGMNVTTFRGIPIRIVDAITNAESRVV